VEGDSKPSKKEFKRYPIGYFHVDLAEVRTAEGKLSLFVAIPCSQLDPFDHGSRSGSAEPWPV